MLAGILTGILPALFCVTFHEYCHGLAAYLLGDNTAKERGRLTLNPLRHIDPLGLIMMAAVHFGWAKPVPVNMTHFQNPKRGMALTALAGPLGNLFSGLLALFLYGFSFPFFKGSFFGRAVLDILNTTAFMSVSLAVFNCLPIPPLDGSKVLFSVLPDRAYARLMSIERYGMLILLALIGLDVLSGPLSDAVGSVYKFLFPLADWGYSFARLIHG